MKSKDELIQQAINNINEDRTAAKELLEDVAQYIGQQQDRYATSGMVAAKYLETLQRSNEQLVKLAAIVQRQEGGKDGMSKKEKDAIFDLINEG